MRGYWGDHANAEPSIGAEVVRYDLPLGVNGIAFIYFLEVPKSELLPELEQYRALSKACKERFGPGALMKAKNNELTFVPREVSE